MNRGDVCWYTFETPDKRRPVLILTRDSAIPVLNAVTVAPLQTVQKKRIGGRITRLTKRRMKEAASAAAFALGFDSGQFNV